MTYIPPISGVSFVLSGNILISAGVQALSSGIIQRYNASALLDDQMVLQFPSIPTINDFVGIKEVGNSIISVELDGNGNNIEEVGLTPSATQNVNLALISLYFVWDGNAWRIV